jgi:hypothetical protein
MADEISPPARPASPPSKPPEQPKPLSNAAPRTYVQGHRAVPGLVPVVTP